MLEKMTEYLYRQELYKEAIAMIDFCEEEKGRKWRE